LVERSEAFDKHVYLPTYGHGRNGDLAVLDQDTQSLWGDRGFTVHALGDFNAFAERQGVVHCIKKYISQAADLRDRERARFGDVTTQRRARAS
jgi:hypothetical protein